MIIKDHNRKSLPRARPFRVPQKEEIHGKKSSRAARGGWRDVTGRDERLVEALGDRARWRMGSVCRRRCRGRWWSPKGSGRRRWWFDERGGRNARRRTEDTFTLTGAWPAREREARCSKERETTRLGEEDESGRKREGEREDDRAREKKAQIERLRERERRTQGEGRK